ncbi:hypothetical protein PVAND_001910 [Polypedilum vanderplanki]|uniref:Uncharacterized protein n=1 Tax=Polypedilum vanderplanki TaxID=319348 RepID=A0A9J6BPP4_POLVA|nr:hypothetical protein PVAND_001910 [Polypedilum vanderplanki]
MQFLQIDFEYDFKINQIPNTIVNEPPNSRPKIQKKKGPKMKHFSNKKRTSKWKTIKKLTDDPYIDSNAFLEAALNASQRERNFSLTEDAILLCKNDCYPQTITVTDVESRVKLQDLFYHTTHRLLLYLTDQLTYLLTKDRMHIEQFTIYFSIGFDGASGYNHFNIKMTPQQSTDEHIFAATLVPLRLSATNGEVIWQTPSVASTRLCRTIFLRYEKESHELIKKTAYDLKKEIAEIKNLIFKLPNEVLIQINSKFYMTMLDGKCVAVLNDTLMQSCPVCKRKPKEFHNVAIWDEDKTNRSAIEYGFSVLHNWIRIFECLLHVGYKKVTKKSRSGNTDEVKTNKLIIQQRFESLMNIRIDVPNPRGGNSNTGNVARRAFSNSDLFGICLGFDENETVIIKRLRNILLCFTGGYKINPEKLKKYNRETYDLWLKHFYWFTQTPTLHRLLLHGHEVAAFIDLPIGLMTEEGQESMHKIYRFVRSHHSRQSSRENNLLDIHHASLELSDPFYSLTHFNQLKPKSKRKLPRVVLDLLEENFDESYVDETEDVYEFIFQGVDLEEYELGSEFRD